MPTVYDTSTRQPLDLDGDALQQALTSGQASYAADAVVPVYSANPDDQTVYQVPATKLRDAMSQGYTAETPSQLAVRQYVDDPENQGIKGTLKVALGQAANQYALGLPEIAYDKLGDPLEVAKTNALEKAHTLANIAGGAVGMATSFFAGPGNPLARGAEAAGSLASNIADKILINGADQVGTRTADSAAKAFVKNLASNTAGKAVEGAVFSAPQALTEAALSDKDAPGQFETAGEGLLIGALTGGAFGVAGSALDGALQGSKALKGLITPATKAGEEVASTPTNIAAKIAKTITGVDENDVLQYAQNPERINAIGNNYTQEGLKDEIDSHVKGFQQRAEQTATAAKEAENQLNQDYNNLKVQWSTAQAPRELADSLVGAQQTAKKQLGEMSDHLFDFLSESPVTVQKSELTNLIDDQMSRLEAPKAKAALDENGIAIKEPGTVFGNTAKTEYSRLKGLKNDISTLPDEINLSTIKNIVKQMDPDLNFQMGAGEFNDFTNKNGKEFRKFINDKLRVASPDAAYTLDQMSALSKTLGEVNDKFGTVEKAVSNTNNLFSPRGQLNREVLEKFGNATGQDFITPLKEFEDSKSLLRRARTEDLRSEVLSDANANVMNLKYAAKQAADDYAPISRLTEGRTQNIVKNQSGKSGNIIDRKSLEALNGMTGKDYNQMIKDLSIYQNFYKEHTNGSRRVALGGVFGALLGTPGAAAGAGAGAAMDVYGGQLLKNAIDKSDNFRGLLLAQTKLKDAAQKIDLIPDIVKRMADKLPASPSTLSLNAITKFTAPKQEETKKPQAIDVRHQNMQQLRNNIIQFTSNPEKASSQIGQLSSLVSSQGAPKIGDAFNQKLTNAVTYLQNIVPKERIPPNPLAPKIDYKPSDSEIRQFERKLSVVQDPFSVLKDLENGTLTKDHVEALTTVYPKLYSSMQDSVFKAAANGELAALPYNKRIKLSMFMGSPMDTSLQPQNILKFQQSYGQQDHSIDPANKKQVNIADSMQSDVQKLSGS